MVRYGCETPLLWYGIHPLGDLEAVKGEDAPQSAQKEHRVRRRQVAQLGQAT